MMTVPLTILFLVWTCIFALVTVTYNLTNFSKLSQMFLKFKSEIRLKAEGTLRQQLTEDVKQLESLIDALTSVCLIGY